MKLSYVALPLLSSALLLVACGDDADGGSGGPVGGSAGASAKGGSSGKGGASGSAAGGSSNAGSGGGTSKGGSAGSTSKGGSAGSTSKGGSAGSTSKGGEGGSAAGGEGGSSAGGKAGTSAGGKAGAAGVGAAGASAGSAGAAGGGEAGRAGEGGSTVGGAAGTSAGGTSAGGTSAGGEGGTSAGGTSAGGEGGTSAGGEGGTSAGGTSAGGTSAAGNGGASAAGNGGTSAAGAAGSGGAPVVCREVTVNGSSATAYDDRIVFDFANIGGAARDAGGLFFDEKPAAATYTLGSGQNADPNSAKQLFAGYEDANDAGVPTTFYVATKGSLAVSAAASTLRVKGTLTDVTLTEATAVGNTITVKPGGACLHITSAAFDTSTYCAEGSDCGTNESCNPTTNRCTSGCADLNGCATGETCLLQDVGAPRGACYSTCKNTFGATCGGGSTCNPFNYASQGYCIDAGTVPEGGACAGQTDTTTDCAPGLLCVPDVPGSNASVCRATCANVDADPKCPAGRLCLWDGYCSVRNDAISPAQVGQPCATAGIGCHSDGKGATGFCFTSGFIPTTTCRQMVYPGGCPNGTTFQEVSPGLASKGGAGVATGVCIPLI